MVFMPAGGLVVELGIPSPLFYHYRHAAAALQLSYHHFEVDHGDRGAGAPNVKFGGAKEVGKTILEHFLGPQKDEVELEL